MAEGGTGGQTGNRGKGRKKHRLLRSLWAQSAVVAPALIVVAAGFIFAWQFVAPAPPDHVVMATGSPSGAYHAFGQLYAERFRREGIDLELRNTAGSMENLGLLDQGQAGAGDEGVAVAFLQGGIGVPERHPELFSLGSVYYEPIWVFVRGIAQPQRLTQLAGKRIAVGGEGSGTRDVALKLLADNNITAETATLSSLGGGDAATALKAGRIDAAVFVTSVTSKTVRGLLAEPSVTLMSFERADAYLRRNNFLSKVVLPKGIVDLAHNLPHEDTVLLAPAATIVASPQLHPALVDLMLLAMRDAHRKGGYLEARGEFPSPAYVTYPLEPAAQRFYDRGPPFLQRYLPFAAANLIDRLKVMLLPLITLLYPLFKLLPPVYSWRMRARVNRWYKDLQAVDDGLHAGDLSPAEALERLGRIEQSVEQVSVPVGFAARAYTLRLHLEYLRGKAQGLNNEQSGEA
jgi:TRAP transporter TAXI family solute receptor